MCPPSPGCSPLHPPPLLPGRPERGGETQGEGTEAGHLAVFSAIKPHDRFCHGAEDELDVQGNALHGLIVISTGRPKMTCSIQVYEAKLVVIFWDVVPRLQHPKAPCMKSQVPSSVVFVFTFGQVFPKKEASVGVLGEVR